MTYINIGRKDEIFWNYKMEALRIRVQGRGSGIKTNLLNIFKIAQSLRTKPEYIMKYLMYKIGVIAAVYKDDSGGGWIGGAHEVDTLQQHIHDFIDMFILCPQCNLPETNFTGKADKELHRSCKACGYKSKLECTEKCNQRLCAYIQKDLDKYKDKMVELMLRQFTNFKSNEENVILFFHGFMQIHDIPNDIMRLCMIFYSDGVYDEKYKAFNDDKWRKLQKFHKVKWEEINEPQSIADQTVKIDADNSGLYKYELSTNKMRSKQTRKIWKIKFESLSECKDDKASIIKLSVCTKSGISEEFQVMISMKRESNIIYVLLVKMDENMKVIIALNHGNNVFYDQICKLKSTSRGHYLAFHSQTIFIINTPFIMICYA